MHSVLKLVERIDFFVGASGLSAQTLNRLVRAEFATSHIFSEADCVQVLVPPEHFVVQGVDWKRRHHACLAVFDLPNLLRLLYPCII